MTLSKNPRLSALALILICLFLVSCSNVTDHAVDQVAELSTPAGQGAQFPFIVNAASRDMVFMSWLEEGPSGARLLWASYDGQAWTAPELISKSEDFFVNWADFPSIAASGEAPLAAHWLQKVPGSTYAYHVNLALRSAQGEWSQPITPHADQSASEHGFASMLPLEGNRLFIVWLDGHQTEHGMPMTLHSAEVNDDGSVAREAEIDGSVCDCCQTSIARSGNSILAVYRDRSEGEIRDIYRAIYDLDSSTWSQPLAVSDDGWEIHGCPVNGPQVAAHGETVIVSWFTAANDLPRSSIAVSHDGGATFSDAIQIDTGQSDGRVGVTVSESGTALLTWIESGEEKSSVMARFFKGDTLGEAFMIGDIEQSRASGFPRAAALGEGFVVAWTDPAPTPAIRAWSVNPQTR